MDNLLLKYLVRRSLRDIRVLVPNIIVISTYMLRLVPNFIDITTVIESYNDTSDVSKCFA